MNLAMNYKTRQLMLSEVIEKLQRAMEVNGDVPVSLDIRDDVNAINDYNVYKCVDVVYDDEDVRLYNY